jgi:hypothetical protein
MKVKILLQQFYLNNGIPKDGGADNKTFLFQVFGLPLKLPNPEFRRKALYIHDIQHVLNKKDTSWKGEGFIAGWEIGTGMWKHFPLSILALWAMAYSLWLYPKSVFQGFKKGLINIGIIDMNFSKDEFMNMDHDELTKNAQKTGISPTKFKTYGAFLFWIFVSQFIFLAPIGFIMVILMLLNQ